MPIREEFDFFAHLDMKREMVASAGALPESFFAETADHADPAGGATLKLLQLEHCTRVGATSIPGP